ncbi:molybdenum ABC transporter ATP-binding protein [Aliidiomarina sp. Khilg15.8]
MSLTASVELKRAAFTLNVTASLPDCGITAIFGPSGCGKTTLLRIIAGLEQDACGSVQFRGEHWLGKHANLAAWQRPVGMVFQNASLFPHLHVQGNLEYAIRRATPRPNNDFVARIVNLTGLSSLLKRKPEQLSGGQQQRVAIARALVAQPSLLLMDEPLANLDGQARHELLQLLRQVHTELNIPILYVSHQLDEVVQLADHLLFMQGGQASAVGALQDQLNSARGRELCGGASVLFVQAEGVPGDDGIQRLGIGEQILRIPDPGYPAERLLIYASDISISRELRQDSSITNQLRVELESIQPAQHPAEVFLQLRLDEQHVLARITRQSAERLQLAPGQQVIAHVKAVALR